MQKHRTRAVSHTEKQGFTPPSRNCGQADNTYVAMCAHVEHLTYESWTMNLYSQDEQIDIMSRRQGLNAAQISRYSMTTPRIEKIEPILVRCRLGE